MSKSKVARSEKRNTMPAASEPDRASEQRIKAAAHSDPFLLTGAAFDGGENLRSDCTAGDLIRLMFEAPDGGDEFLPDVLRCAADDWALLQHASHGDLPGEVLTRVALRNEWRLKVALHVAERMSKARDDDDDDDASSEGPEVSP